MPDSFALCLRAGLRSGGVRCGARRQAVGGG